MATTQKSSNLSRSNTFGPYAHTPDHQNIEVENYTLYQDAGAATGSPISTVSSSADTVLKVPNGAAKLRIYSSVALRISDEAAGAAGYFVIPATTLVDWPCTWPLSDPTNQTGNIYLRGDATSATVQFAFLCI